MTSKDLTCAVCFAEEHQCVLSDVVESPTEQWHWVQVHERHSMEVEIQ